LFHAAESKTVKRGAGEKISCGGAARTFAWQIKMQIRSRKSSVAHRERVVVK
jgi:hypothetical protein